jgi:hypothetical protein
VKIDFQIHQDGLPVFADALHLEDGAALSAELVEEMAARQARWAELIANAPDEAQQALIDAEREAQAEAPPTDA